MTITQSGLEWNLDGKLCGWFKVWFRLCTIISLLGLSVPHIACSDTAAARCVVTSQWRYIVSHIILIDYVQITCLPVTRHPPMAPWSLNLSICLIQVYKYFSLLEYSADGSYRKLSEVSMPTMSTVMIMKAHKNNLYVGLLDGTLAMYSRTPGKLAAYDWPECPLALAHEILLKMSDVHYNTAVYYKINIEAFGCHRPLPAAIQSTYSWSNIFTPMCIICMNDLLSLMK